MKINSKNIETSISLGSDQIRVDTRPRIEDIALILLRGLSNLRFLNDLKLKELILGTNKAKISNKLYEILKLKNTLLRL